MHAQARRDSFYVTRRITRYRGTIKITFTKLMLRRTPEIRDTVADCSPGTFRNYKDTLLLVLYARNADFIPCNRYDTFAEFQTLSANESYLIVSVWKVFRLLFVEDNDRNWAKFKIECQYFFIGFFLILKYIIIHLKNNGKIIKDGNKFFMSY